MKGQAAKIGKQKLRRTSALSPIRPILLKASEPRRSRFNTSVTQMVQNIGNTWPAELDKLPNAVEKSRTYEPEKRVCIESASYPQL